VGLFAASVVTVIAVWRDLDPEVILLRASVAGVVCGLITAVIRALAR
jgi:hypothetical protein